jgi:hypothetical protein
MFKINNRQFIEFRFLKLIKIHLPKIVCKKAIKEEIK